MVAMELFLLSFFFLFFFGNCSYFGGENVDEKVNFLHLHTDRKMNECICTFKNWKMHYNYYFREMIKKLKKKRDIEEKWK